jgi:fatty acid desaturase
MTRSERVLFCVFVVALASLLTVTNGWLLFAGLWLLPMFTFGFWLHHLRTIAEHLALEGEHELNESRTVVSSPIERFLVAPMGVNFHLEHHLFPGIPAYHLAAAHRVLMSDEQFRAHAHITRSYLSLLHEITR